MKRNHNLRNLSSDHHEALSLARRIIRDVKDEKNGAELASHVRDVFNNELSKHFDIEESSILPELSKAGEHSLVDKTLDDHVLLRQLARTLEQPGNLVAFAEKLKAHVRFEEQELFEICQRILDDAALDAIGRACIR